jgi:hypothetical protein
MAAMDEMDEFLQAFKDLYEPDTDFYANFNIILEYRQRITSFKSLLGDYFGIFQSSSEVDPRLFGSGYLLSATKASSKNQELKKKNEVPATPEEKSGMFQRILKILNKGLTNPKNNKRTNVLIKQINSQIDADSLDVLQKLGYPPKEAEAEVAKARAEVAKAQAQAETAKAQAAPAKAAPAKAAAVMPAAKSRVLPTTLKNQNTGLKYTPKAGKSRIRNNIVGKLIKNVDNYLKKKGGKKTKKGKRTKHGKKSHSNKNKTKRAHPKKHRKGSKRTRGRK